MAPRSFAQGLLNVTGRSASVAIRGVGPLVHVPTHLARGPDTGWRSRLVVARGLDPALIHRSMDVFDLRGDSVAPAPLA